MPNLVPAGAVASPPASVLPFVPPASRVPLFIPDARRHETAFVALSVSAQFIGLPDAAMDRTIEEMLDCCGGSAARMIRDNGEALRHLRSAAAFLFAIDARMQASVSRVLAKRGC